MSRPHATILVALVGLVLAAACGGSGSSAPTPSPTANASDATSAAGDATAASTDAPELLARALQPADIGAGWSTFDDDNALCDDADKKPQRSACADASYENKDTGESIGEMVGGYEPGAAATVMRALRAKYGNVTQWQPIAAPAVGYESIAFRSRITVSTNLEFVVRIGDELVMLTYHAPVGLAAARMLDMQSVVSRAVTRAQ